MMLEKEANIHKFLFDQSFEPEVLAMELAAKKAPVFTLAKIEEEKRISYEKGYQDGYSKAYTEIEEKVANTLSKIHEQTNQLIGIEQINRDQVYEDTVTLTSYILNRILPSLFNHYQKEEIIEFIKSSISGLKSDVEVQVIVHPSMHENIHTVIQKILHSHHIVLTSHAEIAQYDCRIQWINGGKERLFSNFIETVDQTLDTFLTHLTETYSVTQQTTEIKKTKKKPILEKNHEK